MDINELKRGLEKYDKRIKDLWRSLDINEKKEKAKELEKEMQDISFWDDKERANNIISNLNLLRGIIESIELLKNKINNNLELAELLETENDEELKKLIGYEYESIESELKELEIELLLNKPYDKNNAIVEIHSGAGGTEACDWADMIYHMYLKWSEKRGYKIELIDYQAGDEVGIKSVSILIKGVNAYGYLKCEKGIHRLVRISPFDANKRRHTSFASVDVIPEFDDNINIEMKDEDLKIDVYKSGGSGGQSVNTTDSAVRVTHLPTKIVVTCQNERSQIKNREIALKILKHKLYKLELDNREKELNKIKGTQSSIDFGSQIRSYVIHPYTMVKDHRTNYEISDVNKVLDGDIDIFIEQCLKKEAKL
ncbi:MAG: peptide chain release factor 2 [Bacilli bacterium]|nr:peptide chain release factor 2 [Bacilli bacterium]